MKLIEAESRGNDVNDEEVLRKRRLADFCSRAKYAPDSVYRHGQFGWKYIPIHPFADEPEVLVRLALLSEACQSADAWWSVGEDATLLQAYAGENAWGLPGLYARTTEHPEQWTYLLVCIDERTITRSAFEEAMAKFVELGFPGENDSNSHPEEVTPGLIRDQPNIHCTQPPDACRLVFDYTTGQPQMSLALGSFSFGYGACYNQTCMVGYMAKG